MKISLFSRVALGAASLAMIATFFLPLWQIQLWAPQYPEGLNMKIWFNRLSGAFEIINGLNHYIGMREIRAEMFPEFQFIGYLLGGFILLGAGAALAGRRLGLQLFVLAAFLLGAVALWDFYRWGYDYGHNLDPHAAIVVPGMAYQPPVIGYKNLLNFTAYSGPDQGGWVIIAVGVLAVGLLMAEYFYFGRKRKNPLPTMSALGLGLALLLGGAACSSGGPQPIRYGFDACHACKMTLTDKRFGVELISAKGKVFLFDDLNCALGYAAGEASLREAACYVVNFSQPGGFVEAPAAFYLRSPSLRSPMRSDVAAFGSAEARAAVAEQAGGEALDWPAVQQRFRP
jgi:copper chaperone NosL